MGLDRLRRANFASPEAFCPEDCPILGSDRTIEQRAGAFRSFRLSAGTHDSSPSCQIIPTGHLQ